MNRIAILSNRLPPMDREKASADGLVVSLGAVLEKAGGIWLGWDGTIASEPDGRPHIRQSKPAPLLREQTTLLQTAAPSRENVSEYADLKRELEVLTEPRKAVVFAFGRRTSGVDRCRIASGAARQVSKPKITYVTLPGKITTSTSQQQR